MNLSGLKFNAGHHPWLVNRLVQALQGLFPYITLSQESSPLGVGAAFLDLQSRVGNSSLALLSLPFESPRIIDGLSAGGYYSMPSYYFPGSSLGMPSVHVLLIAEVLLENVSLFIHDGLCL